MVKKLKCLIYLVGFLSFAGCQQQQEVIQYGSLYGAVVDKGTGDYIQNACVELQPLGLKVVTGDDGLFEFVHVKEDTYNLFVTKTGYKDYTSNSILISGNAEDKPVNIQLEKLPSVIRLFDDNNNDITSLEFGAETDDVLRAFNIFNGGTETLSWEIIYAADWIQSFIPKEGILKVNETQAVVVNIDRTKIQSDVRTNIQVVSDRGSKQLTITVKNSSEPQDSTTERGTCVIVPEGNLMVQSKDLGAAQWGPANNMCATSTLGGYTDWRLPTLNELKILHKYKKQIGGFPNRVMTASKYWSSDNAPQAAYFYYLDFVTGEDGYLPRVNSLQVRAVRTITQ